MADDLVKYIPLYVPLLVTDDSRLGQMSVSFFVQLLLTDDSRLGQMSVPFFVQLLLTEDSRLAQMLVPLCATHTYFEKCGAVVALNVGDTADTSGDPTAPITNNTFL